jgi:hypothetical protein
VTRFPWLCHYDTASWLEHLQTHSEHLTLPPTRRRRLLAALGDAIDSLGGSFEVAYETIQLSACRI